MNIYKDTNGDSGIFAYEYEEDWIKIQFKDGYTYEYRSSIIITSAHLNEMKTLADSGNGLNTYINKNPKIKTGYSSKNHNE